MDKYKVKINPKAAGDIDHIYEYLAEDRLAPESAKRQAERLKTAILKLIHSRSLIRGVWRDVMLKKDIGSLL